MSIQSNLSHGDSRKTSSKNYDLACRGERVIILNKSIRWYYIRGSWNGRCLSGSKSDILSFFIDYMASSRRKK